MWNITAFPINIVVLRMGYLGMNYERYFIHEVNGVNSHMPTEKYVHCYLN